MGHIMRGLTRVRATAGVAVVAAVLGAGGCGTSGDGASAAPRASASARAEDSGPFTKDRVQADLDTSTADAGAPPADPDWAAAQKAAPAGSLGACGVLYKGYGTESAPVDLGRYDAVIGELRERGWQEFKERKERKSADGTVGNVVLLLKKRDWTMTTEFRGLPDHGEITLDAFQEDCVKKARPGSVPGLDAGPVG